MKKSVLLTFAMFLAGWGVGNAAIEVTATNIEQPTNDTLLFALPVDLNVYQDIQNFYDYPDGRQLRFMKFQPEYIVTAQDFSKGDVNMGTPTLPANAKVIGLALDGYDVESQNTPRGIYHEVTAWCRNIPRDKVVFDYTEDGTDLTDGYRLRPPVGQLCIDTISCRGYSNRPGYINTFDPNANAENPCAIVDIPFNVPDEEGRFIPFWYTGENIYLTLWICNWSDVCMKYRYMAFDDAEGEMASLMRTGNFCFNNETKDLLPVVMGAELMYDLPEHRLPAFRIPYFTNDVRVTCEGYETEFELRDADGNVMERDEDGNYYSLDHTKEYFVFAGDKERGSFSFGDTYKDVNLVINNLTAVEDIVADKAVANVVYFNLAGQQSAQPVEGVNIVVTTYTDGSTTTAKVIK
ncbi:MAG: hypothetical protein IKW85_00970 [Muribaculaceae bacterium]|nr:hypothetical protein [Muribaculaceae bacterium]